MKTRQYYWQYLRSHYASLYITAYGIGTCIILVAAGVAVQLKLMPNFVTPELQTALILFLCAVYQLLFFQRIADETKKKEGVKT